MSFSEITVNIPPEDIVSWQEMLYCIIAQWDRVYEIMMEDVCQK